MEPKKIEKWITKKILRRRDHQILLDDIVVAISRARESVDYGDEDLDGILDTMQDIKKGDIGTEGASKNVMKEKKNGRIVNISSAAAYTGRGGGVHYASTKGGMNGLTLALARELASYGILVNGIAPAVIDSDFLDTRYPTREERDGLADNIPVGRIGTGEDIANIVVFLCSDLSNYISGETILADGGRTFTGS